MIYDPTSLPYLHGAPLGNARFKVEPSDFLVEERLGFEPSGEGEHCLLWVEKTSVDSNVVSTRFADALGIRRRLVSHCGLKDRHAVTRQWFSIHLPGEESPDRAALESEGVKVLRVTRNTRKLKRGTHVGNGFTIRLRDPDFDPALAVARWELITQQGVPNFFGPQRFGHGGRNVEKAIQMFSGEIEIRDRLLRGLLLSSARSYLFNAVVAERLARGNWDQPLAGEVYGFTSNRSIILPQRQRDDEKERFVEGALEITAPLWGRGELLSEAAVRDLEKAVVAPFPEITKGLEATGMDQERRVMRLRPEHSRLEILSNGDIQLRFDLPKGTYATALLRELTELVEENRRVS